MVVATRGYVPLTVEHALRVSTGAPENANIGKIELERLIASAAVVAGPCRFPDSRGHLTKPEPCWLNRVSRPQTGG